MAGEWIAYDLALPQKPEVQELIDTTGLPVQAVVYNLLQLWGWASMHCADGTARMTLPRLVRTCGATEEFWSAVASVGWLEIDETAATVAVPGWDRRFSQAAKSRLQHRDRAAAQNEREPDRRQRSKDACAQAQEPPAHERSRGDKKTLEVHHHHPREAWEQFRQAWNAGKGRAWTPATPPEGWAERFEEPGWFDVALEAIGRIGECRYFKTPPTLIQFVKPGWAHKVLGGSFDEPKQERRRGEADAPPPPKDWDAETKARVDATRRREAARIAAARKLENVT